MSHLLKNDLPPLIQVQTIIEPKTNNFEDITFSFTRHGAQEAIPIELASLHRHHLYELIWVTQGQGSHAIDFHEYPLQSGQFFLIAPGQVHEWKKGARFSGFSCLFSEEIFCDGLHNQSFKGPNLFTQEQQINPIIAPPDKISLLKSLANLIANEFQKDDYGLIEIHPHCAQCPLYIWQTDHNLHIQNQVHLFSIVCK